MFSPRSICPVVGTERNLLGVICHMAGLTDDDLLVDIGCGDGRLLVHAAQHCGCEGLGLDIKDSCLEDTRRAALQSGVSHLIEALDFDMVRRSFDDDLVRWKSASVVYAYLMPDVTRRIEHVLLKAVQDGKVVVLYCSSGSRVRRPNAPLAGNVIADLQPKAHGMMGRLRLYAMDGVLEHRLTKFNSRGGRGKCVGETDTTVELRLPPPPRGLPRIESQVPLPPPQHQQLASSALPGRGELTPRQQLPAVGSLSLSGSVSSLTTAMPLPGPRASHARTHALMMATEAAVKKRSQQQQGLDRLLSQQRLSHLLLDDSDEEETLLAPERPEPLRMKRHAPLAGAAPTCLRAGLQMSAAAPALVRLPQLVGTA